MSYVSSRMLIAFLCLFTGASLQHEQDALHEMLSTTPGQKMSTSAKDSTHALFDGYVIAVPSRRAAAREFIHENGLETSTVIHNATLKTSLNRTQLVKQGKVSPISLTMFPLQIGDISCTMSHQSALRRFLETSDKQFGLIFEDDAWLEYPVQKKLGLSVTEVINRIILGRNATKFEVMGPGSTVRKALDVNKTRTTNMLTYLKMDMDEFVRRQSGTKTWDLLNLGRCYDNCCAVGGQTSGVDIPNLAHLKLVFSLEASCGHSYLVTRHGAQQLLEEGTPISEITDDIMVHTHWAGKIRQLSVTPRLFKQRVSMGSLIHEKDDKHGVKLSEDATLAARQEKPECDPYAFRVYKGCPKVEGYKYPPGTFEE